MPLPLLPISKYLRTYYVPGKENMKQGAKQSSTLKKLIFQWGTEKIIYTNYISIPINDTGKTGGQRGGSLVSQMEPGGKVRNTARITHREPCRPH